MDNMAWAHLYHVKDKNSLRIMQQYIQHIGI